MISEHYHFIVMTPVLHIAILKSQFAAIVVLLLRTLETVCGSTTQEHSLIPSYTLSLRGVGFDEQTRVLLILMRRCELQTV